MDTHSDGLRATSARLRPGASRRWRHVLLRVYHGIERDRILANAAAVTYYALLAIFPGIAALVSLYGLFADPGTIAAHLDTMAGVVPGGAIEVIRGQLTHLTGQPNTALGVGFVVSLGIALWSANSGIKALFDALNAVYEESEKRGFVRLNAITLAFTLGAILLLMLALGCVIVLPVALSLIPQWGPTGLVLGIAGWPLLALLAATALSLVYRYGPCCREPRWRWISWGGAAAAILWLAASAVFSWYAANFGNFDKTYGSLGAVAGFMTWLWISVIVVLLGGKLNAEIEQEDRRRSAIRPRKARRVATASLRDVEAEIEDRGAVGDPARRDQIDA